MAIAFPPAMVLERIYTRNESQGHAANRADDTQSLSPLQTLGRLVPRTVLPLALFEGGIP